MVKGKGRTQGKWQKGKGRRRRVGERVQIGAVRSMLERMKG